MSFYNIRSVGLLPLLLLLCFISFPTLVHGSLGPVGGSRRPWGIGIASSHSSSVQEQLMKNHRRRKSGGRSRNTDIFKKDDDNDIVDAKTRRKINDALLAIRKTPRGGQASFFSSSRFDDDDDTKNGLVRIVGTITQIFLSCGKMVLPPTVAVIRGVVGFYRHLPTDVISTQIGLVYCFAGGYYPTLFSSLQAAHQCGWEVMVAAIDELTIEAIKVIDAIDEELMYDDTEMTSKDLFLYQTNIVLKTVDPMKINQAAGALYTTWLGISAVLEKEYARTISLALTLAEYFETVTHWILEPPVRMCVSKDYHKWIPVVIGWGCKGMAMNIAWRIQRVLTAATSAMFGGAMVARSLFRIISKRSKKGLFGRRVVVPIKEDSDDEMSVAQYESSLIQDIIGFIVAGIGFYTQIDAQYANAFSFEVPFPISLVTWPFDWAEKWIQWYITK